MKKSLKDYFIPHAGNEYHPLSLRKFAVAGMGVLILLSFSLANVQSLLWVSSEWMVSTILPAVIVDLTNDERDQNNLQPLQRNSVLDIAATLKATHMAENQYFSHYSPDGISPWHWFNQADYKFVNAGENLAIHFTDSDEVVDAWMDSPTHRENIVNGAYTEIGVGAVSGTYQGFKTVYVVQLFGTPARPQFAASENVMAEVESIPAPEVLAETTSTEEAGSDSSDSNSEEVVVAEPDEPAETAEEPTEEPTDRQIAGSQELISGEGDSTVSLSTDRDPVVVNETNDELATETAVTAETDGDTVSLYSDLIATSTGGIPATTDPGAGNLDSANNQNAELFGIATKPHTVLQVLYVLIGMFVLGSLLLSILIEVRRQQPVQLAYSVGLVAVMATLFYVHVNLAGGVMII